jgi:hypothetical protein
MPTILRVGGYRFIIFTNDHNPPHIHVQRGEGGAKIGLQPLEVVEYYGLNARQLGDIIIIVKEHHSYLLDRWNEFHGDD